ncbi:tyrosine-type recombinase/integrase [Lentibacter sp. XHP0401]|uniref:tyrosine-type recombinase/integrase n=1 Tax=Lentibacter sp. XHP0401 TaxID=2984334 RepID=UPI0021E8CA79|nr:tyrosine-type recombinase/integrase [Lentibacter sp. XHP0401]MCV2894663.1 tyrosine-type recombinase/integrase [Lentibacter sp. XHP0401]
MAKLELTDAFIKKHIPAKREDYVDTREPGLTMRMTPIGNKTFSVRVRSLDGVEQRVSLGAYPDISLKQARAQAAKKRAEIKSAKGNINKVLKAEANARSEAPTLQELIDEYKSLKSETLKIWQSSKKSDRSEAERRIQAVFAKLLNRRVVDITADELADALLGYIPLSGKGSANGQTQKARLYLMPVLDWAAGRERFRASGRKRLPTLEVPDLRDTIDPASEDPEIRGERDHVLERDEIAAVLPWLTYPARPELKMRMNGIVDVRPIALKFILLTAARLDEVVQMRWKHVDFSKEEWFKPEVKTTRGLPRSQTLPLSRSALDLLKSLPSYERQMPEALVFPSTKNTPLGNWNRITKAIQRQSGTSEWHRHDLRRTSASILRLIGTDLGTIDRILAHRIDHSREGTSRALESYLSDLRIVEYQDPQKTALNSLADVYETIEGPPIS